ncbi:hypothetical protein [Altibacter lentus]|uniref:hypothetical protein n=1 Tax=Altibacter lentus TaxID=1223410 RepID=UPI0005559C2E|nr:hypothetical protein [Altibacter lentus]
MTLSLRLEQALTKLYRAFHEGTLHPECARQCAVGNICDHSDTWRHFTDVHGSQQLNYVGLVHQRLGRRYHGYTPQELLTAEAVFLKGCGYSVPFGRNKTKPEHPTHTDTLFEGLCAVTRYLCELEGVKDVMHLQKVLTNPGPSRSEALEITF